MPTPGLDRLSARDLGIETSLLQRQFRRPDRAGLRRVGSGSYFPVLGVGAALGRVFSPEDEQVPGGHPYAVLSHRYWVNRFASDPRIIGQKMIVNGCPLTIVGVSQAGFDGLDPGSSPQIRVPVMMKAQMDQVNFYNLTDRRGRWVNAYGRLKPGVTLQQAKAGLQPLFHQMLEIEVREAALAKTAELTKQNFLRMLSICCRPPRGTPAAARILQPFAGADGGGGCSAADRLREPGEPAGRANDGAAKGNGRPACVGSQPDAHRSPVDGGKHDAGRDRRGGRPCLRPRASSSYWPVSCRPAAAS